MKKTFDHIFHTTNNSIWKFSKEKKSILKLWWHRASGSEFQTEDGNNFTLLSNRFRTYSAYFGRFADFCLKNWNYFPIDFNATAAAATTFCDAFTTHILLNQNFYFFSQLKRKICANVNHVNFDKDFIAGLLPNRNDTLIKIYAFCSGRV